MLQTIERNQVRIFRDALRRAFVSGGVEEHIRTITTPGGPEKNVKLLWKPGLSLWMYLADYDYQDRRRHCWFGKSLGPPNSTISAAVEMNLAVDPDTKSVNGRGLTDAVTGAFFFGHKGTLGGGRGGELSLVEFEHGIQGFAKDTIRLGSDRTERVFVIGDLAAPDFLPDLDRYVAECIRLRADARTSADEEDADTSEPSEATGFRPEFDQDGFKVPSDKEITRIRRLHGRVVNALEKQVEGSSNARHNQLMPDLYLRSSDGTLKILFEVKALSTTQSWYTALGQLVVYGAQQPRKPMRVLVCPGPLKDPSFLAALQHLEIQLVTFTNLRGRIKFEGLDAVLRANHSTPS